VVYHCSTNMNIHALGLCLCKMHLSMCQHLIAPSNDMATENPPFLFRNCPFMRERGFPWPCPIPSDSWLNYDSALPRFAALNRVETKWWFKFTPGFFLCDVNGWALWLSDTFRATKSWNSEKPRGKRCHSLHMKPNRTSGLGRRGSV
jgi:hypothetical protein